MLNLETLRDLSLQIEQSDLEKRMIIMYYIYWNCNIMVDQVMTAQVNDKPLFDKNLEIAKDYFKSFT